MHALKRVSRVTGDTVYTGWAMELAHSAHSAFTYPPSRGDAKRMYWKMSIDLTRPLAPSMGHNPRGWKAPCYLITDAHHPTFAEMMAKTDWEKYRIGKDPRCAQRMMHCGFEPTVVNEIGKNWKDMLEMMIWNMT